LFFLRVSVTRVNSSLDGSYKPATKDKQKGRRYDDGEQQQQKDDTTLVTLKAPVGGAVRQIVSIGATGFALVIAVGRPCSSDRIERGKETK
jgi:hypothetical protein